MLTTAMLAWREWQQTVGWTLTQSTQGSGACAGRTDRAAMRSKGRDEEAGIQAALNDEEGMFAHRRAKALDNDVRAQAAREAHKTADDVLERYAIEHGEKPSLLRRLGRGKSFRRRPQLPGSPPRSEGPDVPRDDLVAAALADLVIEQHTQLRKAQLNLVKKATGRAAVRAAQQAASAKSRRWQPNRARFRGKSLGLLTVDNPIRWGAIYVCTHGLDELALILIFINTVMLTLYDPHDIAEYNPDGVRRTALTLGDKITSVLFAMEVLLRIIAQGALYGPTAFLADGWGWLDFFIAVTGILQDFVAEGAMPNMSIVRVAKILKPLRVITHIPQLRLLVVFILRVVPVLNIVLLLIVFIYFVFGVIGVQLFQGTYRQECYAITTGLILAGGGICSQEPGARVALCPSTHQCLPLGKGRYQGIVSFDNVGSAVMTVLQIVTLQGWTRVMDEMQAAQSSWVAVYFVVLILVCMHACTHASASDIHVMHDSRGAPFTSSCSFSDTHAMHDRSARCL